LRVLEQQSLPYNTQEHLDFGDSQQEDAQGIDESAKDNPSQSDDPTVHPTRNLIPEQ
jgi:hypothetical protein